MRDAGQRDIETVTLAYDAFEGTAADEAPLAAMTAQQYGTRHHTRRVSAEEFAADLPKILAAMDQPSVDGVNTWFVSKATREIGLKVAISGVGGDELLGGYDTFRKLPRLRAVVAVTFAYRRPARRHALGGTPRTRARAPRFIPSTPSC